MPGNRSGPLFQEAGKSEFQRFETDAARNFIEWYVPDLRGRGVVLSLGGGTIENPGAMAWIERKGVNVYIRGDRDMLFRRIMANGRPPFLSEGQPEEDWARLYEQRDRLYSDFAAIVQDVDDAQPNVNAQRLLVKLQKSEISL